jgi:hypothetical protein
MEIFIIYATVVLTAMIISEGFGGCREMKESSDELNEMKKRLDHLKVKPNESI